MMPLPFLNLWVPQKRAQPGPCSGIEIQPQREGLQDLLFLTKTIELLDSFGVVGLPAKTLMLQIITVASLKVGTLLEVTQQIN